MTLWVPQQPQPAADPTISILIRLARQGSVPAIIELEQLVALKGLHEKYALSLLHQIFQSRDFEVTTGPGLFGANEVRHHFKTGELFQLMRPYPMQRVKAIEDALSGLYDLE